MERRLKPAVTFWDCNFTSTVHWRQYPSNCLSRWQGKECYKLNWHIQLKTYPTINLLDIVKSNLHNCVRFFARISPRKNWNIETPARLHQIPINPHPFLRKKTRRISPINCANGLIQPLLCENRLLSAMKLAGERRLRASQLAEPPRCNHQRTSDEDMLYQSIIENLQRADLNPYRRSIL